MAEINRTKVPMWISTRMIISYVCFFGFFCVYAMRINLSVAIVAMVNSTAVSESSEVSSECPASESSNVTEKQKDFNWSQKEVGSILGAFFYGYLVNQVPGGWLASKYGGKWFFGIGILVTSISTLITPIAAHWGVFCLIIIRVITGMAEAVTFPAYWALVASWAPALERTTFANIGLSGATFGNFVALPLAGYMCKLEFLGGWPLVFYTSGGFGVIWFVIFCFTVYNSPKDHPYISDSELHYIQKTVVSFRKVVKTPWFAILTSLKFWAMACAMICHTCILYSMMTCLPAYLANVLNFDIDANGMLSALPFLASFIIVILASILSDYILKWEYLTRTSVRKINTVIGSLLPAISMICAGYAGCDRTIAVACIIIAQAFSSFLGPGGLANPTDLAPIHAGTIYSIGNTFATIPGFVAPLLMAAIVNDNPHSPALWKTVFMVFAAFIILFGFFFVVFGSGDVQPWGLDENPALYAPLLKDEDTTVEELRDQSNFLHHSEC